MNYFYDHREKVYYLNKQGAELIGMSDTPPTKNRNYEHVLMRNDLYIHYGMPRQWLKEHPIPIKEGERTKVIRPDVTFQVGKQRYFAEVDNTQKMSVNIEKVKDYEKLKRTYSQDFPKLIWLTKHEIRRKSLSSLCKDHKLESEVFLVSDIR